MKITFKLMGRIVLLVGCLIAFGHTSEILGCSCVREKPVCESVGSMRAIFVGKVVGAKQQNEDDGQSYDVGEIYFEVIEAFAGVNAKAQVTIRSGTGGADCGYWFTRGETYLIYAYGDDSSNLSTNICTRTRPLSQAGEDLEILRNLPPSGSGVRIFGEVSEVVKDPFKDGSRQYKPLQGVKLTVQQLGGAKRRRVVATDSEGKYELNGLPAGKYQITPTIPRTSKISEYSLQGFEVRDRGCRERDFVVENNSRITGRLIDADKKPLKQMKVELLPAYGKQPTHPLDETTWTDEDGTFDFEEVPTGSYILAVNFLSSPDEDAPFPVTFYPTTSKRDAALIIEIRAGKSIENLEFQMPERLATRIVEGFIIWPDGSPAADAEVHLEDLQSLGWCVNGCSSKADKHGRFSLKAYAGRSYRIRAEGEKVENGVKRTFFAPMPTFSADQENLRFKLVLGLSSDPAKADDPS